MTGLSSENNWEHQKRSPCAFLTRIPAHTYIHNCRSDGWIKPGAGDERVVRMINTIAEWLDKGFTASEKVHTF